MHVEKVMWVLKKAFWETEWQWDVNEGPGMDKVLVKGWEWSGSSW